MIIVLLPLSVWVLGYWLSWLAGAPPYKGMVVVLFAALLGKISGPWIYLAIGLFLFWFLVFRWLAAQLAVAL